MRFPKINFREVDWKQFGIAFAVVIVLITSLGLITGAIVNSTHPDKKVREGKVIEHKFIPAHDEDYTVQVYDGETCFNTGYGTSQTRQCQSHYHTEWRTDHIPDAWWIRVEGCKRLKAADPLEYCEKTSKRRVWVTQSDYDTLKIGTLWREISS